MTIEAVSATGFAAAAEEAVRRVAREQTAAVAAAADLVVGGLRAGGVVQAFGTGHSQALAMELSGRAGGLVPTNMIALRDLVLLGGEPPELLSSGILERDPSVSRRLYELVGPAPADLFVISSNSGVNGSIVEMAEVVK